MGELLRGCFFIFLVAGLVSCSSLPEENFVGDTEETLEKEGSFDEGFEENEEELSNRDDVEEDVENEIAELSGEKVEASQSEDAEEQSDFEEEFSKTEPEEIAQERNLEEEPESFEATPESVVQQDEVSSQKIVQEEPEAEISEAEQPEAEISEAEPEAEVFEPEPEPETVVSAVNNSVKNIEYKSQMGEGAVVIETLEMAAYQTRVNEETNQLVIEVAGTRLPRRLKRPFNTSQFGGSIGAIQAYQKKGSDTARIVIQLIEGASIPQVVQEGNSLFIISQPTAEVPSSISSSEEASALGNDVADSEGGEDSFSQNKILPASNLDQFLASNTKFYGKKISLQSKEMDIREVIGIIAEESGINLVISDDVSGKISIKLRDIPWDQALVMVMKTKGLAYVRSGNILRIAKAAALRKEIKSAQDLLESQRKLAPLKVSVIPVSYAKVEDLSKKIGDLFKSKMKNGERGSVISDDRTSSLIVTATEDLNKKIKILVKALDTPPQQVLIEGKIIEARETFIKSIGVSWGFGGGIGQIGTSSSSGSPINMQPSLDVLKGQAGGGALSLGLSVGKYDLFGNINAALALNEQNDNIRVLSSPSVLTLNNKKASIKQTAQVPNISSTKSQDGTVSSSIAFSSAQLSLDVEPHITADNSILLSVDLTREFPGATITAGTSTATPINSRNAKANVMVRNGQTAVFAGIYQNDTIVGETGVPILKDIPFLGRLFRANSKRKEKTELLLFLTPRIVNEKDLSTAPRELLSGSDKGDIEEL